MISLFLDIETLSEDESINIFDPSLTHKGRVVEAAEMQQSCWWQGPHRQRPA